MTWTKCRTAAAIVCGIIAATLWGMGLYLLQITFIPRWIPFAVALAVCIVAYPILYKAVNSIFQIKFIPVSLLLYVFLAGSIGMCGFLGGNYFLGDKSDEHIEHGIVVNKYSQTRNQYYRHGRRTTTTSHYLTIKLPSGQSIRQHVSTSAYVHQKMGARIEVKVRKGAFGYQTAQVSR